MRACISVGYLLDLKLMMDRSVVELGFQKFLSPVMNSYGEFLWGILVRNSHGILTRGA